MGVIEVRGCASRTVRCDIMKIELNFHASEDTADKASNKVMHECEDFLGVLKNGGIDVSKISIMKDSVCRMTSRISNYEEKEYYEAQRVIEIDSEYDMEMINSIRTVIDQRKVQANFHADFYVSNMDEISQELFCEALKDARIQAEKMAAAIDRKITGLVKADKNDPRKSSCTLLDYLSSGEVLCQDSIESFENTNMLSAACERMSENIYTTWEVE